MDYKRTKYRNLTSEGAILRDWVKPEYLDEEHKMLCDIADCLYNANVSPEHLTENAKKYYHDYGKNFFDYVLRDMGALDSQLTDSNKAQELLDEYRYLLAANK